MCVECCSVIIVHNALCSFMSLCMCLVGILLCSSLHTAHTKKFFLMWLNQNVIVVMGVEKLNTFMFFFFYLYSPGSSDKASLNQQLKLCHENWKFDKTNTSPLKKNKLLTLKGLSLSPTLFKVLLQNPEKPTLPQEDSQFNTI